MKFKPIIADPVTFLAAGFHTLYQAAVLVHLGRCGLQGATRNSTAAALKTTYSTVSCLFERMEEAGWICRYGRHNTRGREARFVIGKKGWELITKPPELHMFPGADAVIEEKEGA